MAVATANGVHPLLPGEDLNGPQIPNVRQKYDEERDKRIRPEGVGQYITLKHSDKYKGFLDDPWASSYIPKVPVPDGGQTKILILGAGMGGILFAVRLIKAGIDVNDLLFCDPSGGFGGTWYWNRYPGLMCDVESYIYLPLLEDTGYMPKRRYSSGTEIREYLEKIASQYELHSRAMFPSTARSMVWDSEKKSWTVKISRKANTADEVEHTIHANFVLLVPGVLSDAKLPDIQGIDAFRGHMFHTARWDYKYTGGTPEEPNMTGLRGKKVALIGTGATAIQAVPELAKFAEKLFVFQRTPSAVDVRNNRDTDPHFFKTCVATKPGWQKERSLNFAAFLNNADSPPQVNLVDDGWTKMAAYCALIGGPKKVTMENVGDYIEGLYASDAPRQERIRGRTADIVRDPITARSLQAWYPGWCKRPTFHDGFLQTFNLPHVELVDTNGRGIDSVSEKGVHFGDRVYDVDVIIWATGFQSPGLDSPAGKMEIKVKGKADRDMEETSQAGNLQTLHGCTSHGFPNMFWTGSSGVAASANYPSLLDLIATHVAYIISEATRRVGKDATPVVEPTTEGIQNWVARIMEGGLIKLSAMAGCTPSYLNMEGGRRSMTPADMEKASKNAIWTDGFASFVEALEAWRAEGSMKGLELSTVG